MPTGRNPGASGHDFNGHGPVAVTPVAVTPVAVTPVAVTPVAVTPAVTCATTGPAPARWDDRRRDAVRC
ncbi:hypothetical protein E1281_16760 [Actinomadura sp. KC345]|nr:hypothetical protein E1281_16760 [Actinomadura sp. KC345]